MASGITHARVATTGAALLTASAAALYVAGTVSPVQALGIVAGAVAGWLITPDIDHHMRTVEEQRMYAVGTVIGALWQAYWLPYEKIFSHHGRGRALTLGARRGVSHWLVIGTLTRFVYLLLPLAALLWTAGVLSWPLPPWVVEAGVAMFAAWAVQDALHLLWDL